MDWGHFDEKVSGRCWIGAFPQKRLFDQQNRRESSKNPRPPTPRNPRNARFTRSAEMPDHPDLPEFADQISLAPPAEFQSDPKIPRFARFCRSEIATLLMVYLGLQLFWSMYLSSFISYLAPTSWDSLEFRIQRARNQLGRCHTVLSFVGFKSFCLYLKD